MNLECCPITALTWNFPGFWWFAFFFFIGLSIGWFIWKSSGKEVKTLELENTQALKEYDRREKEYSSNLEAIDSLLDPDSK